MIGLQVVTEHESRLRRPTLRPPSEGGRLGQARERSHFIFFIFSIISLIIKGMIGKSRQKRKK